MQTIGILNKEDSMGKIITFLYFTIASIGIIAQYFDNKPMLFIFKPLISVAIMVLYWNTSALKNRLFYVLFFVSLVTNLFFIPNTQQTLFFGIITFLLYRVLMIYYIIKLTKLKDFIPLLIAVVPFVFVFFYLFSVSSEIPKNSYFILIIQNVMVAVLGGIALADYVMNDNKNNSWLLICGLLSVSHYFFIFIEKYYLPFSSQTVFRPLAMLLNTVIFYTFYRFVIETESPILNDEKVTLL